MRSGLLIDLSRMNQVTFDSDTGIASAQPGVKGRDLNALLAEHSLFFPSGHCPSVGIGGFLLQGGWGWNSRAIGPACISIVAVDVVTASGDLIHADAQQNSDFWWAARGSGGGYFGVVTRFYLRCHPRPTATYTRTDVYSWTTLTRFSPGRWSSSRRCRPSSSSRCSARRPPCPMAAPCTTALR